MGRRSATGAAWCTAERSPPTAPERPSSSPRGAGPGGEGAGWVGDGSEVGDRSGVVHGGTLATYGTGTAIVVTTGGGTELGRISSMLGAATENETRGPRSG